MKSVIAALNSFFTNHWLRHRGIQLGLVILTLLIPIEPLPVLAQAGGPTYVVQEGDTLYSIARAFSITVETLQQANGITDPSLLAIGQILTIPGYEGIEGTLITYRVQLGDTLRSLAKRFGTSEAALIKINRLTNPELLYVGETVVYPELNPGIAYGTTWVIDQQDSFIGIAARTGHNPWTLALLNDLNTPFLAYSGQSVIIPDETDTALPMTGLPAPFLSLSLRFDRLKQGSTLEITAGLSEAASLEAQFLSRPIFFAPDTDPPTDNHLVGLHGIDVFTEPGLYPLILKATEPDGTVTTFEQFVPVADASYPTQQLFVGTDQTALLDPSIRGPEAVQVSQVVAVHSPVRLWDGPFQNPIVSDRITTGFGWRRSYNGGPYENYHDGLDYGAPNGTTITASADGVVVFAGPLLVRGNTTIIDHGWGVYSGYFHAAQILVQVGQSVVQGEPIGEVGSTGLSTGNHLHFVIWVGGQPVDPTDWKTITFP